ncbi:MAG: GNAT family N-acetyltransferase [Acidimicrobiales bacterium]
MIRDYAETDAPDVLALNEANLPELGPMDQAKLDLLANDSPCFKVVEVDGRAVGMLIVLDETSSYPSLNYGWFRARHEVFAYVDRIALGTEARGAGWGPALYEIATTYAVEAGKPVLCAEVNTVPPNPRSHRFHEINGFVVVEHFQPYGGPATVAMFEKALA